MVLIAYAGRVRTPPADVKGFTQIYNPDFHFGLCTTFQGFGPAFFCEIRQKFIVRIHPWVQNTFRWPRAYRDEAFKALGRIHTNLIGEGLVNGPFFLVPE